jgi:hypothetical protein
MGRKKKNNQYGDHVLKRWMFSPEKNTEHFFERKKSDFELSVIFLVLKTWVLIGDWHPDSTGFVRP